MAELFDRVRPSPIAGRWYEGDECNLRLSIQRMLGEAATQPLGNVIGLIAPHAGHVYSGATAALAYKAGANERPATIVILSPHHAFTRHQCVSSAFGSYATPLGKVEVDHDRLARLDQFLRGNGFHGIHFAGEDSEHAIEIQLPFLQVVFHHPFKLVPLMLRDLSQIELDLFTDGLVEVLADTQPLIVSSTDLSHFYPEQVALAMDGRLIEAVGRYSIPDTIKALTIEGSEACGAVGLLATMAITEKLGGKRITILGHTTSADVTGDTTSVVGYMAAAITA